MFGFLGQHVGKLDYTQYGARIGSGSGQKSTDFNLTNGYQSIVGKAYHDFNNEGVTLPINQSLTASTPTTFNSSNNRFLLNQTYSTLTQQTGFNGIITRLYRVASGQRGYGWTYNILDTNQLNPPSRRTVLEIDNPRSVLGISISNTANIASSTHNKGHTITNNRLDLTQFTNLRQAFISDVYQSSLLINFPQSLKYLSFVPKCNTISNGTKLPKNLETFSGFWATGALLVNIPSDFFDDCNLTSLNWWIAANSSQFPSNGSLTNSIVGSFDFSHMSNLKEFTFGGNTTLTSLTLPTGKTDWEIFLLQDSNNAIVSSLGSQVIEDVLDSSPLKTFIIRGCSYNKTRNINNDDIGNSLVYFWIHNNSWTGNINITNQKSNLREFKTGNSTSRTGTQQNSHPTVNISGLTNVTTIDLTGSNIENLELPSNTVCTSLLLFDNKLDISTNPNLLTQVNNMTGLVTLRFSLPQTTTATSIGQNSTNGLGSNPSFVSLSNLTTLGVSNCKINGTLTLPSSTNKIVTIEAFGNTGMTSIANFSNHSSSIVVIRAENCNSLNLELSGLTNYNNFIAGHWANSIVDISNRTATSSIATTGGIQFANFPNLHTIKLPASTSNFTFNGQGVHFFSNPQLTGITNLSTIGMGTTVATCNIYSNSSLNISFPFNTTFRPSIINISSNNMSQANVDTTIDNLYTIRSSYSNAAKSLNIAGTNSTPSGTYQAPAGYVQANGVTVGNDGTPASAKEQIYVLVNQNIDNTTTKKYNWTITYTP